MTDIDTIATIASGTAAMVRTVTKHINGEDGFENDEERLFAVIVKLVEQYVDWQIEARGPDLPDDALKGDDYRRHLLATAVQAIGENVLP